MKEYWMTKKGTKVDKSLRIVVDSVLGFKRGDLVNLEVRRLSDPPDRVCKATKVIGFNSGVTVIYINSAWGFTPDDMLVLKLSRDDDDDS